MGRIIVITSGKGGVGKTTVTASLGSMLAAVGQRVALIDADIGLNNLDVALGIENRVVYDILDVVSAKCRVKQALVQDAYYNTLYILPSSKLSDSPALSTLTFKNVVNGLAASFDYVIIDCPAGIDSGFHRAVSAAEEAIVVTTPHASAIRDADKVLNLLTGYDLKSVGLVVNRIRGDMVARGDMMSAGDITRLLRTPPVGVVPEDDNITLYSGVGRVPRDTPSNKAFAMMAATVHSGQLRIYDYMASQRGIFAGLKRKRG